MRKLGERDRAQADALIGIARKTDEAADKLGCPPLIRQRSR